MVIINLFNVHTHFCKLGGYIHFHKVRKVNFPRVIQLESDKSNYSDYKFLFPSLYKKVYLSIAFIQTHQLHLIKTYCSCKKDTLLEVQMQVLWLNDHNISYNHSYSYYCFIVGSRHSDRCFSNIFLIPVTIWWGWCYPYFTNEEKIRDVRIIL